EAVADELNIMVKGRVVYGGSAAAFRAEEEAIRARLLTMGRMWHLRFVEEKAIAITGGEAAYFELMRHCIGALAAPGGGGALALGVLDCGLTDEQRAWCKAQGATLVTPQWDFDFPGRAKLKDGYKALTARPFLPRYFPGFDLYLWIDGDCWVQQGDALALF